MIVQAVVSGVVVSGVVSRVEISAHVKALGLGFVTTRAN
jgi:hypothetical protein